MPLKDQVANNTNAAKEDAAPNLIYDDSMVFSVWSSYWHGDDDKWMHTDLVALYPKRSVQQCCKPKFFVLS
jgi:hypothetical protein